jgi:hypothetical protein
MIQIVLAGRDDTPRTHLYYRHLCSARTCYGIKGRVGMYHIGSRIHLPFFWNVQHILQQDM